MQYTTARRDLKLVDLVCVCVCVCMDDGWICVCGAHGETRRRRVVVSRAVVRSSGPRCMVGFTTRAPKGTVPRTRLIFFVLVRNTQ